MPGTDLIAPSEYRALTATGEQFTAAVQQLQEQEVGEFDLTRIKIPSGGGTTWEIPTVRGGDAVKTLQGVILFAKFSRAYWPGKYEGGNEPPSCSSNDGRTARQVNEADVRTGEPIVIPAQRNDAGQLICDTCAYAEFGSGQNPDGTPSRRQACKQMRQLFLLLPGRLLPAVLTLPPTSLRAAKTYLLGLVDEGLTQHSLVTYVELDKQKNEGTPEFSVARFKAGEPLTKEQTARASAYADAARPRFMKVVATAADLPAEETGAAADADATAEDEPAGVK